MHSLHASHALLPGRMPLRPLRPLRSLRTLRSVRVCVYEPLRPLHDDEKALLQNSIAEARRVCEEDKEDIGCVLAWDAVDEIVRGLRKRREFACDDPLEIYCTEYPENDECRTYE